MLAILHNIRSVYNTASIFRTADGAGVDKLYLSGYTPTPKDRFDRQRKKFQKVALGADEFVAWEQVENVYSLIDKLQDQGVSINACEPTAGAVDYREAEIQNKNTCFIFGNEPDGLPEDLIAQSDQTIEIPMLGEKTSLNVAVSFGVIAYHALKQD